MRPAVADESSKHSRQPRNGVWRSASIKDQWQEGADPWTVKSCTDVHRNEFFSVESCDVTRPDGATGKYQIVRVRRLGVGALAVEDDGSAYMIGQWRLPLGRFSWELPMGGAEPGEDALDAAKRELSEECGIEAKAWVNLSELDVSTSLTDERCVLYLAYGLCHERAHPETSEKLRRRRAPFMELVDRADRGLIREAATVAALMRAYRMAMSGALPPGLSSAMLKEFQS